MSKYEREGNAPEDWRTDVILQRSTNGTVQDKAHCRSVQAQVVSFIHRQ